MNNIVLKAKEIDNFDQYLPELEVGEEVELNDVWDGSGEVPEDSTSYFLGEDPEDGVPTWINYTFDVIEKKEKILDTVIVITGIELL